MKHCIAVLCAVSLLCTGTALADNPIYVDGNGHIITQDAYQNAQQNEGTVNNTPPAGNTSPTVTAAPNNGNTNTNTNNGGNNGIIGDVPLLTEAPDNSEPNENWRYDSTKFYAVWQGQNCEVVNVGQRVSTIRLGGETVEVYTRDLTWETTAPEDHRLCIVTTKEAARMYKSAKNKAAIIWRCTPGSVLPVYEVKKGWVKVHYEDADGWLKTKAVDFLSVDTDPSYLFGYVCVKGKYPKNDTVRLRQKPSAKARTLTELPFGQRLIILDIDDSGKWVHVDTGLYQGYILSQFVLITGDEEQMSAIPRRGTTASRFETVAIPQQPTMLSELVQDVAPSGVAQIVAQHNAELAEAAVAQEGGQPDAPTEAPAQDPTETPTEEPIPEMTAQPTEAPEQTEQPAEDPTEAPAPEQSEQPAEEPTEAPQQPADVPAEEPATQPAEEPASDPAPEADAA